MENKTAVVTGGGQGIGKAVARQLLEINYNVVIAEIDQEAGRDAENELRDFGTVSFIETDVGSEPSVTYMINETIMKFGGLNVLVNNAGIFFKKPISTITLEEWNRIISVNLTGTFLCSKYAAPHVAFRRGSIINIASTRGLMSEPDTESYSASKGGIIALTHSLAISLGPDVRVNCISPGWIDVSEWKKLSLRTVPEHSFQDKAQHPAGRVGTPYDISSMVLYLIDDNNTFITGQNFVIDGGMTRKMIYV